MCSRQMRFPDQTRSGSQTHTVQPFNRNLLPFALLNPQGFMPEEIDAFVQDYLYPSYSPTVLAFLGASSLYGLWKTGKLPGMTQG